jgi:zinc transporter ZupT
MKLKVILVLTLIAIILTHGNHGKKKKQQQDKNEESKTSTKQQTHTQDHNHDHPHDHHDHHDNNHHHEHKNQITNLFTEYNQKAFAYLYEKLGKYNKLQQGYIGAFICSLAPIPIFFFMIIFNIKNVKALDILSAFAAGAILGDVLLHNLPEIYGEDETQIKTDSSIFAFFLKKEIILCIGVLFIFFIEKIMGLFVKEEKQDHHSHSHCGSGLSLTMIGDFLHNLTDGLAIGAAFGKSIKF